jgi:anti-sigma B factor antagonist
MGRAIMSLHELAVTPTPASGGLRFSARAADGYTIATLRGDLDVACTPVLREQLLAVLKPGASRLIVDLSKVSFCDASGLAVLVSTGRRATLLGGTLRLVAPSPAVAVALRLSGLLRQFDIFPTVIAAATPRRMARQVPAASAQAVPRAEAAIARPAAGSGFTSGPDAPAAHDLREAVAAVLAHADAWRDADPKRRFTSSLGALARAQADGDHAGLAGACRSLVAALNQFPLVYSPTVAATARDLRRLVGSSPSAPVRT